MENTENKRERINKALDLKRLYEQNQVTTQQKAQLQEFVAKNSGILEGRFYGPLQQKQSELWNKLKDQLNQNGAQLSVPEWKKVWWDLKKEMKEKPSLDDTIPSDSGFPEDEDVMVVLEERKMKTEDNNEVNKRKSDGRYKRNPRSGLGDNAAKRKRQSLSPVSSISSFNSKTSISPPRIGDISKRSYSERSKSPSKSKRSPLRSRGSSHYRKKSSHHSRYGKSRSPSTTRSTKHSSSRLRSKSPSESREPARKRYRSKSPAQSHKGKYSSEWKVWETFRTEVDALEAERWADEQMYKKNPEKHPDYKNEWKKFYKSRVKDLLNRGKDPKSYNFESEWAYFWKWKMDELLRADLQDKKDAIRRKLKLPEDDTKSPYKPKSNRIRDAVDDSQPSSSNQSSLDKTHQHASEVNVKTSDNNSGLISTLRIVTAVEEQLGSLGPQVNSLLSQSVALHRIGGCNPDALLANQDNFVLLETVREKLMGQIQSKIVRKSLVGVVMEAIDSIDNLLKTVPSPDPLICQNYLSTIQSQGLHNAISFTEGVPNVNIPGVGSVDRVAIAQQIAEALIKQGKTNVTEAELQELVNAVLGMAKTQAIQERNKELASFHGENIQNQVAPTPSLVLSSKASNLNQITALEAATTLPNNGSTIHSTSSGKENSALDLLMSVVQSGVKKPNTDVLALGYDSSESDNECSEDKIALNKFTGFKLASRELKKNLSLENAGKLVMTDFKINSEEVRTRPLSESYHSSYSQRWHMKDQNTKEDERVDVARRNPNRLSPFSSRKESSNPLPSLESSDLKIIGAWDSDSDIDLDASEKTKAPAYEKVSAKQASLDRNSKNASTLCKPPNAMLSKDQDTPSSSKSSIPNLNINIAIDDLMGSLNRRSTEKQISSGGHIHVVNSPSKNFSSGQHGEITNPNYAASFYQQSMSTQLGQPSVYNSTSTPGYINQYSQPNSQYTYRTQSAPHYSYTTGTSGNQYNTASYASHQDGLQPAAQIYYGSGEYGQMNPSQQGYYNYQPNYSANPGTEAHSANYQLPYH